MKVRVKQGNRWGEHGPGTVLDLDPSEVAAHPHCFEDEDAHQRRLLRSRVTKMRLSQQQQVSLGLTPSGVDEGDTYEVVRLDEGVLSRAELLSEAPVHPAITATAVAMGYEASEDGPADKYVERNVERAFATLRTRAEAALEHAAQREQEHGNLVLERNAAEARASEVDAAAVVLQEQLQQERRQVATLQEQLQQAQAELAKLKETPPAEPPAPERTRRGAAAGGGG